ncbi:unnamed protein product [Parnassius apollo]|uniref:(apollo) hypothetical protein n=1 Tax=Parnassius apollo TaxID=110799 RepID=A0A8S3WBD1_PARAO|nr:unnamed protein product [Parnassius apollo]
MEKQFSLRIGTWNVQTMLQAGKMDEVGRELKTYNLDLIALQEIRWQGTGTIDKDEYTLHYSCADIQGHRGTGFIITKKLRTCVLGFEPVNDRLCKIRIKGKLYNTTYVCAYSPTEDASDEDKEKFYEELHTLCSKVPKYDALCVLGDFNAKVGKENVYADVIGCSLAKSLKKSVQMNQLFVDTYREITYEKNS